METSKPRKSQELQGLVDAAQKEMPGVFDLLKVYGGLEETIREAEAYLEVTRLEPRITTSNQSMVE